MTYTVVLDNGGPDAQDDNPGDGFVDVLPAQDALVSATATRRSHCPDCCF